MRAVGRWVLLGLTLLACLAVSWVAYTLAGVSWDAVVDYSPPRLQGLSSAEKGSAVASRTVMVIVDGLGIEASRSMGTLNNLRSYGADLELIAPQPSLSYPNWTTLLSGAPPEVSGVVTNWHEGAAPVETVFDTAQRFSVPTVFVGPDDFDTLYGVADKTVATYMKPWDERYLSGEYIDAALRLADERDPRLIVIHLPDVDEAGHAYGSASPEYEDVVKRVDGDLGRLVQGLQDAQTVFVVVADHGHIAAGGHGGWEKAATRVPGVFAGPGVGIVADGARQEDVASSVALLAGIGVPRQSMGTPVAAVERSAKKGALDAAAEQRSRVASAYAQAVVAGMPESERAFLGDLARAAEPEPQALIDAVRERRLAWDRAQRIWWGLGIAGGALLVLALIGIGSWRALVAALAGVVGYYFLYNALFFGLHGWAWSLSSFNSEDLIESWMNLRFAEAALSALFGVAVAAFTYPFLRKTPRGPSGRYIQGWFTLGPATVLAVQATLAVQVAWFIWAWGVIPEWRLPDLMWGFKYDLDLIQATAVGAAAVLAPLVSWLVGRYHPNIRVKSTEE